MKKIFLSFFLIFVFVAYVIHQRIEQEEVNVVPPKNLQPSSDPTQVNAPVKSSGTPPKQAAKGKYKDGVYTGKVADAFYGNLQVKAIIQSGKIVDVQFLQYPNDRETSIDVNTQAMPLLKSEAISIQGSQVDIVTGATESSIAFRESLSSALSQAM